MAATLIPTRDWSSLPQLAVFEIATRLNPIEFAALASICKSWRTVCTKNKTQINAHHPPLLLALHCARQYRYALPSPLVVVCSFPDRRLYSKRPMPRLLANGLLTHYHGFSHGYVLFTTTTRADVEPITWTVHLANPFINDLIWTPATPHEVLGAVVTAPPSSPDCLVVALSWNYVMTCRPGVDDTWNVLPSPVDIYDGVYQAVFFKGRVYALTYDRVVTIDVEPEISGGEQFFTGGDLRGGNDSCFVLGDDELFLVKVHLDRSDDDDSKNGGDDDVVGYDGDDGDCCDDDYHDESMDMVYRLKDWEKGTWEKVRDFGGRILFACEKCPGYVPSCARLAGWEEGWEDVVFSPRPTGNIICSPTSSFSPPTKMYCAGNLFSSQFKYVGWIPPSYFC